MRIRLTGAWRPVLALFILIVASTGAAQAQACGGANQRPCTVFERIPSCNSGLVEDFSKNRCVRPAPKPRPASCGRQGQRPCTVVEFIPSCANGLAEDFAKNVCIRPNACGAENQRPCNVVERVPSCNSGLVEDFGANKCVRAGGLSCGREGQRPCLVVERVPSCNASLVEDFGANKCVRASSLSCGREGQRPCLIVERIPSCDPGLAEDFVKGACIRPNACGAKGERPCNIVERVPSCNDGLAEDFVLSECVPAAPLDRALCMTAVGLAQRQSDASAPRVQADQSQANSFMNTNPGSRDAIQSAIDTLIRTKAPQIDNLIAIGLVLSQPEYDDIRRSIGDKETVCLDGKLDLSTLKTELVRNPKLAGRGVSSTASQASSDPVGSLLGEGAVSLSVEWEANAVIGLASSLGPVVTYGPGGVERWGAQLSSQLQVITEASAGAGVQVGWWPGSKLASENSLASIVGRPRDGELAGPYVSAHAGGSGGFMGRAGVSLDFVFEVPEHLSDLGNPSWYLDNFSGVTVTVSASVDPTPVPFKPNLAVALGNTLTVSILD